MPEFSLRFGDGTVSLPVPMGIGCREVVPRKLHPLENPENAVRRALRNPVGQSPIAEIAKGKKNVCICISDNTRKCEYKTTLPILLDELVRLAGVPRNCITILIAGGTHRQMSKDEMAVHLGGDIASKFKIAQHDGSYEARLRRAGRTSRGTVIFYNPIASDSDFIILAGAITYHYFAGFTGGRKALFPGVAAHESIIHNHSLVIDPDTGNFHDRVRPGSLLGNPVHEDMMEAAGELRPDFLMDVVLNEDGKIAGVFAGDFSYAHRIGCQFVEDYFGFLVGTEDNPYADIAVASAGGYPRDINFYQSHKSIVNATNLLNPAGGHLVLLAECREGLGHAVFEEWKEFKTADAVRLRLKVKYTVLGHLVLSLRTRAEKHRIYLVSKLSEGVVRELGLIPAQSPAQALGMIFSKIKAPYPAITLMPYASLTTPIRSGERVGINAKEMNEFYRTLDAGETEDMDAQEQAISGSA